MSNVLMYKWRDWDELFTFMSWIPYISKQKIYIFMYSIVKLEK